LALAGKAAGQGHRAPSLAAAECGGGAFSAVVRWNSNARAFGSAGLLQLVVFLVILVTVRPAPNKRLAAKHVTTAANDAGVFVRISPAMVPILLHSPAAGRDCPQWCALLNR